MSEMEAKIRQLEYVLITSISWQAREFGVEGIKQLVEILNSDPMDKEAAWNARPDHKEGK